MMINKKKIKIHFVGIGGIGMSGIAELMHEIGYTVFGSDKIESENVKRLKKIGIIIYSLLWQTNYKYFIFMLVYTWIFFIKINKNFICLI